MSQNRNISPIWREAPAESIELKVCTGVPIGDVITGVKFKCEKFHRFWCRWGSKFALSHRLCTWALPQGSGTALWNDVTGDSCHDNELPSCQISVSYALPFSTYGTGRQRSSTLNRVPPLFQHWFTMTFLWPKMKIHDLSAQHIFPSKRYTTYECIPELVVTVPSARSSIVKKIKRFII